MFTKRQQEISDELSDLLQTLRFTGPRDDATAEQRMINVVLKVDEIVTGQLSREGVKRYSAHKVHDIIEGRS